MTDNLRAKIAELRKLSDERRTYPHVGIAGVMRLDQALQIADFLAAEAERLAAENERLCRLLTDYDSISSCACCDMKLGWKYAGDGTCCIEIETGKPHECPVEWGKFPEGTYRFQEARAIAAEKKAERLAAENGRLRAAIQEQAGSCILCSGQGRKTRYEHDSASDAMELTGFEPCMACAKLRTVLEGKP